MFRPTRAALFDGWPRPHVGVIGIVKEKLRECPWFRGAKKKK